jgi:hypothetical protein
MVPVSGCRATRAILHVATSGRAPRCCLHHATDRAKAYCTRGQTDVLSRNAQSNCIGVMNSKTLPSRCVAPIAASLTGALLLLAGCATEPASRRVSAPPPAAPGTAAAPATVIVPANQPAPAQPPAIIVQQAPPAVQPESPTARPSDRHVWVAGYWAWQNQNYVWIPGQWVVAPREGATWVPPRWEREGTGYRFYDGYWD